MQVAAIAGLYEIADFLFQSAVADQPDRDCGHLGFKLYLFLLRQIKVDFLRISKKYKKCHRAEPGGGNLVEAFVHFDDGGLAHGVVALICGSVSLVGAVHRYDGMPPFEPVVIEGDIDNRAAGMAFLFGDILAETVCAGNHHEVVVR